MIKKGLICVLILGIIASVWAFYYLVLPRDVFYWDESHHALYGLHIYQDIQDQNWDKFWSDTGRQTMWCFLHSWFLGAWFLIFGLSYASARSLNLVFFVSSMILTYLIAIRINREKGWIIGIIASTMIIFSASILDMASACMIEALSMFFSLLFVLTYITAVENKKSGLFFLAGVFLGLLTLSKYQHGFVMSCAVFVIAIWGLLDNRKLIMQWFYRYFALFSGAFITAGLWFFSPPSAKKIAMVFWVYREGGWNAQKGLPFIQKILDYPNIILNYYTFSSLIGVLFFVSLFYAFIRYRKNINIRTLLVIIIIPLVLYTIIDHHEIRYISSLVPLIYVLFGLMLTDFYAFVIGLAKEKKKWVFVGIGLISLFLVYELYNFPKKALDLVYRQYNVVKEPFSSKEKQNINDVLDFFSESIPSGQTIAWAFQSHFFTPYTLTFHFYGKFNTYSYYMVRHPGFFKSHYFITIEIGESSPYYWEFKHEKRLQILESWNTFLQKAEKEKNVKLYGVKKFPGLDITAKIYKNLRYK